MPPYDPNEISVCLDEIERQLFAVADSDDCQRFHRESQLTAVLLLLLRMNSLIRPLVSLLASENLDAFDATLRAFEETWYLAFEFRLTARGERALSWLHGARDSWKAKFNVLIAFAQGRGHDSPIMGRDYGLLSELAHPTRSAAENSVTLSGIRLGFSDARAQTVAAIGTDEQRVRYALYRLAWLLLDHDPQFIRINVAEDQLGRTNAFIEGYDRVEPNTAPPIEPGENAE